MNDRIAKYLTAVLGVVLLFATGLKVLQQLPQFKDMILWDEAFYMIKGLDIFNKIPKEWGPAYGMWYKLLSMIREDPMTLYYSNFKILTIAGGILMYVFLVLRKVHPLAAVLLAGFYMISDINLATWPYISHFCLIIILLSGIAAGLASSKAVQWMIFAGAALLLSYARPEFYLAFLMMLSILAVVLVKQRFAFSRTETFAAVGLLAFVIIGHFFMGFGLFEQGATFKGSQYTRQVFAFGQHYAINFGHWKHIDHAWLAWEDIFGERFEVSHSFYSTITSNWPELQRHIFQNCLHYFQVSFVRLSNVLFAENILGGAWYTRIFMWLIILGVTLALVLRNQLPSFLKRIDDKDRSTVLAFAVFAIPAIISCILIYPRDHYLLLQMPILLFLAALIFKGLGGSVQRDLVLTIVGGAFLVLFSPTKGEINHFDHWDYRMETHNRKAIELLRTVQTDTTTYLLEDEGGLTVYAQNPDLRSLFPVDLEYEGSMVDYILANDVKMVFVSIIMDEDPNLVDDEAWASFKKDPAPFGYEKILLPESETYFLVHESIEFASGS